MTFKRFAYAVVLGIVNAIWLYFVSDGNNVRFWVGLFALTIVRIADYIYYKEL